MRNDIGPRLVIPAQVQRKSRNRDIAQFRITPMPLYPAAKLGRVTQLMVGVVFGTIRTTAAG